MRSGRRSSSRSPGSAGAACATQPGPTPGTTTAGPACLRESADCWARWRGQRRAGRRGFRWARRWAARWVGHWVHWRGRRWAARWVGHWVHWSGRRWARHWVVRWEMPRICAGNECITSSRHRRAFVTLHRRTLRPGAPRSPGTQDLEDHVGIGRVHILDDSSLTFEYIRTFTAEVFDSFTLRRDHSCCVLKV